MFHENIDISHFTVSKKMEVEGTIYHAGQCVVLKKCDNDFDLILGKIVLCMNYNEVVHLVVSKTVAQFLPHLGLYVLDKGPLSLLCVKLIDIHDYYPLNVYTHHESDLLILKHAVTLSKREN